MPRSFAAFASEALVVALVAAVVVALVGCGDGHEYPAGFAEQAARDEAWFKAQEEAQAAEQQKVAAAGGASKAGAVAPPRAPIGSAGAAGGAVDSSAAAAVAADDTTADAAPVGEAIVADTASADAPSAEEVAAVRESRAIIQELRLPPPPAVQVADGEEPFMKLAKDRKFDEFRRMCARYLQLKRELLPYGERLASGESTAEDRAIHAKIERAMEGEFPRINRYMWDDRWTELDRAAMGWILNGGLARKPS